MRDDNSSSNNNKNEKNKKNNSQAAVGGVVTATAVKQKGMNRKNLQFEVRKQIGHKQLNQAIEAVQIHHQLRNA